MPILDRDGASIHYEIRGTDGPVVLLTHGFSSSADAFAANAGSDRRKPGYRVVTWDIRGHGQTDAGDDPSAYTVPLALADIGGAARSGGRRPARSSAVTRSGATSRSRSASLSQSALARSC